MKESEQIQLVIDALSNLKSIIEIYDKIISQGNEQNKTNKFVAKIDDTTALGMSHNNHSKHRVYVDGLTQEQSEKIQCFLNKELNKYI